MILSFHPCFVADKNIICAGRSPDADDLAAIKAADAVVLSQGCYKSLYYMARDNCANVFPDYDAKFNYPEKIGQTKLFQEKAVPHPKAETFLTIESFFSRHGELNEQFFEYPFVFKFNWGGGGDNVYLIKSVEEFKGVLQKAAIYENTGQAGFLIQEYISTQNRTLRVVVINTKIITYWRVLKDSKGFCSNLSQGAVIDFDSDLNLQEAAIASVRKFCGKTGINLAGFDIIFSSEAERIEPLFLEINYFFGRKGLGGSEKYYLLIEAEIRKWIKSLGLSLMN
ncbi:MAG: ATP-grasp domain-containing protein [Deltaproteobacteria bacterium]|nr:ATP-grasp domain-containing protein [Deltaproteobacteria bacterium]MBW2660413.1 ATP-grasp domain-containing protein [Deltaproteobacteria bacterium]